MPEIELGRYRPVSSDLDELFEPSPPGASGIPGWITEQEFADQLGLSLATVRRWRRQGIGPKSARIGRRDYYRENGAAELAAERATKAEAERESPRRGRPRRRR